MADMPCPFCGSDNINLIRHSGAYDYDKIHCYNCGVEVEYYPPHIADAWNRRAETDGEHCPFCGGEVEFGTMCYSLYFAEAYCPSCHMRFEFQRTKITLPKERDPEKIRKAEERNIAKSKKAFARRWTDA